MITKIRPSAITRTLFGLSLALSAGLGSAPHAQGFDLDEIVQVGMAQGWRMDNGRHMAAVQITLAPGWHTYWRQPGDSGIPPQFDWSGSENLAAADVHYPTPKIIQLGDSSSLGYYDQVVFPIELTPTQTGAAMSLRATLQIGVCEEVCLPASFDLNVALPASGAPVPMITRALKARPKLAKTQPGCKAAPISDGIKITMRLPAASAQNVDRVVIETNDPTTWVSRPNQARSDGYWTSEAEMVPADGKPFALARSEVQMTLFSGGSATVYQGCTAF